MKRRKEFAKNVRSELDLPNATKKINLNDSQSKVVNSQIYNHFNNNSIYREEDGYFELNRLF
jgi:hypothetical protein